MKYQNPGCPNTMLVFKAVTKECLRVAYNQKKKHIEYPLC